MATLKEIKARIGSVQRTLKITSVMKMVASAKFHRVQSATREHNAYYQRLNEILDEVKAHLNSQPLGLSPDLPNREGAEGSGVGRALVVAFASNNSLCGRFNANAIKEMQQTVDSLREEGFEQVTVIPIGEKIRQAAVKDGFQVETRFHQSIEKDTRSGIALLADYLTDEYASGRAQRILLVYNHFRSMGHQEPVCETFLPASLSQGPELTLAERGERPGSETDYIFEPHPQELLQRLFPAVLHSRLYSVCLDAGMAEHAARTVAMQTATDNAQELLDELSLSYNKQRQQNITNELADITQGQ